MPIGIPPKAVNFNQVVTENKDYFVLAKSLPPQSTTKNAFAANDRLQPVQVSRVFATVLPQVNTTSSPVTRFPLNAARSTTFTTATVLTPKSCINVTQSPLTLDHKKFSKNKSIDSNDVKGKDKFLDNLIQMLKLLKTMPGSFQTPITDLVAVEILKQLKKKGTNGLEKTELSDEKSQATAANDNSESTALNPESKYSVQETGFDVKGGAMKGIVVGLTETETSSNLFPAIKSIPSNSFQSVNEAKKQPISLDLYSSNFHRPMIKPVSINNIRAEQLPNTQIIDNYSVASQLSQTNINYVQEQQKKEYQARNQFQTTLNVTSTEPARTSQMLNIAENSQSQNNVFNFSNSTNFVSNSKQDISTKNEPISFTNLDVLNELNREPQNSSQVNPSVILSDSYPSAQNTLPLCVVAQPQNMLEHNFKLSKSNERIINQSSIKREENNTMMNSVQQLSNAPQEMLPNNAYAIEEASREAQALDSAMVLKLENCDPLLSQANSLPNLELQTRSESQPISTHVPICSMSSEVSIAQLSESELINYINPTCFDNV